MSVQYYIVAIAVAFIVVLQVTAFFKNLSIIGKLRALFPNTNTLSLHKESNTIECSLNHTEFEGTLHDINGYLNENKNTSADYQIIKEIVERDSQKIEEDVDTINDWINSLRESESTIRILRSALSGKTPSAKEQEVIAYNLFEGKKIANILASETDSEIGVENADKKIMSMMGFSTDRLIEVIRKSIMSAIFSLNDQSELQKRYSSFEETRGQMI